MFQSLINSGPSLATSLATTALLETVKRRAEELHTDWFPSKQTTVNPVPVTIAPAVVSAELPTNQDSPSVLGDDLFGP